MHAEPPRFLPAKTRYRTIRQLNGRKGAIFASFLVETLAISPLSDETLGLLSEAVTWSAVTQTLTRHLLRGMSMCLVDTESAAIAGRPTAVHKLLWLYLRRGVLDEEVATRLLGSVGGGRASACFSSRVICGLAEVPPRGVDLACTTTLLSDACTTYACPWFVKLLVEWFFSVWGHVLYPVRWSRAWLYVVGRCVACASSPDTPAFECLRILLSSAVNKRAVLYVVEDERIGTLERLFCEARCFAAVEQVMESLQWRDGDTPEVWSRALRSWGARGQWSLLHKFVTPVVGNLMPGQSMCLAITEGLKNGRSDGFLQAWSADDLIAVGWCAQETVGAWGGCVSGKFLVDVVNTLGPTRAGTEEGSSVAVLINSIVKVSRRWNGLPCAELLSHPSLRAEPRVASGAVVHALTRVTDSISLRSLLRVAVGVLEDLPGEQEYVCERVMRHLALSELPRRRRGVVEQQASSGWLLILYSLVSFLPCSGGIARYVDGNVGFHLLRCLLSGLRGLRDDEAAFWLSAVLPRYSAREVLEVVSEGDRVGDRDWDTASLEVVMEWYACTTDAGLRPLVLGDLKTLVWHGASGALCRWLEYDDVHDAMVVDRLALNRYGVMEYAVNMRKLDVIEKVLDADMRRLDDGVSFATSRILRRVAALPVGTFSHPVIVKLLEDPRSPPPGEEWSRRVLISECLKQDAEELSGFWRTRLLLGEVCEDRLLLGEVCEDRAGGAAVIFGVLWSSDELAFMRQGGSDGAVATAIRAFSSWRGVQELRAAGCTCDDAAFVEAVRVFKGHGDEGAELSGHTVLERLLADDAMRDVRVPSLAVEVCLQKGSWVGGELFAKLLSRAVPLCSGAVPLKWVKRLCVMRDGWKAWELLVACLGAVPSEAMLTYLVDARRYAFLANLLTSNDSATLSPLLGSGSADSIVQKLCCFIPQESAAAFGLWVSVVEAVIPATKYTDWVMETPDGRSGLRRRSTSRSPGCPLEKLEGDLTEGGKYPWCVTSRLVEAIRGL